MIETFYNNIEEKRQELEDYLEDRLLIRSFIHNYRIFFIILFLILVFYLNFIINNDIKKQIYGGRMASNDARQELEAKKTAFNEKIKPEYSEQNKEIAKKALIKLNKGKQLTQIEQIKLNLVQREEKRISEEIERQKNKKFKDRVKNRNKSLSQKLLGRKRNQLEIKKNLKDQSRRLLQYKGISYLTEKLGSSYAAVYVWSFLTNIFDSFNNAFSGGIFGFISGIFRILMIGFIILIILVIAVYLPILFYLTALFLVMKNVLSYIQRGGVKEDKKLITNK